MVLKNLRISLLEYIIKSALPGKLPCTESWRGFWSPPWRTTRTGGEASSGRSPSRRRVDWTRRCGRWGPRHWPSGGGRVRRPAGWCRDQRAVDSTRTSASQPRFGPGSWAGGSRPPGWPAKAPRRRGKESSWTFLGFFSMGKINYEARTVTERYWLERLSTSTVSYMRCTVA